jgi:hypothetical protein
MNRGGVALFRAADQGPHGAAIDAAWTASMRLEAGSPTVGGDGRSLEPADGDGNDDRGTGGKGSQVGHQWLNVPFGMGAEAESQFIGGDQPVVGDTHIHLGDIGGDVRQVDHVGFDGDDRNRDKRFKDRFDGDSGSILDLSRLHGPEVADRFPGEEGADLLGDSRADQHRVPVADMLIGPDFDVVVTLQDVLEQHHAVTNGRAFREDVARYGVAHGDQGVGDVGRAFGVVGVLVFGRDSEVAMGFGEGSEPKGNGNLQGSRLQHQGSGVFTERQVGGRCELEGDSVGFAAGQGGERGGRGDVQPGKVRGQNGDGSTGRTAAIHDGEFDHCLTATLHSRHEFHGRD